MKTRYERMVDHLRTAHDYAGDETDPFQLRMIHREMHDEPLPHEHFWQHS